jgi:hypothetical protein
VYGYYFLLVPPYIEVLSPFYEKSHNMISLLFSIGHLFFRKQVYLTIYMIVYS